MIDDVDGGPGWRIRGSDLRPQIFDLDAFRAGIAGDSLLPAVEALWTGNAAAALDLLAPQPPSLRVRALRADCERDLGRPKVAVEQYEQLVRETLGTGYEPTMRQHLGKALLAADRVNEALQQFELAVALRADGDPGLLASAVQARDFCRALLA